MGRRTGRDDERRMPNCCRWGCSSSRWREVARGAGGWSCGWWPPPQSATDSRGGGTRQSSPEASLLSSAIWPEKASLPAEVSAYQRTMCRLESDSRFSTVA